ncbi:MAG: ABC transporter permease [Haliscomenobacter sp.]|uniref:ABC transporter permease n=1 Tax=Haliscomenobacter sp. TaxID=2717303 RepID=UPI0029AF2AC5|nr:ABC transporter permease [Haliscomenobacter sp.]MDX2071700.1 ABC transporter permease [Haliscomenobacter sp.]
MLRYFFKRLLLFAPTLLVALVLTFGLSRLVPGDPVEEANAEEFERSTQSEAELLRMYRSRSARMGLDKPVFYFAFHPAAYPDTLYKIPFRNRREVLMKLLRQNGNWPAVEAYYESLGQLKKELQCMPVKWNSVARSSLGQVINTLQFSNDLGVAQLHLKKMAALIPQDSMLQQATFPTYQQLRKSYDFLMAHPQKAKLYRPALVWQGFDNQFHQTFWGYLQGNLGQSYEDGKPVSAKIGRALSWTLLINIFALPIAYLLAIFIGVRMAVQHGSKFDKRTNAILFGLYAMPSFWVALVLLVVFSNPDWGMNFVSITGMMDLDKNSSWSTWLSVSFRQLIIPILCLIYPAMTVLTRQMRSTMMVALKQDFVRTARAKGVGENEVIWQHAFPNAAFPLITSFGSLLPEMVAGSLLVENIFNIPGMGHLMVDAMGTQDWPVVFGIMLLGTFLSIVGLVLVDLAYAWLDPRVRFDRSNLSV